MPFTTVSTGAPSVFADSSSALADAYATLSTTSGGGTIYITGDFDPSETITLFNGGSNPVHITSANPNNPAEISHIGFTNVDNVMVSNVHVDSTGVDRLDFMRDMDITNSSRIEITDSTFTSNGSTTFDPADPSAVLGERLSMVRNSEDITVSNNYIAGYEQGLTFQESSEITVSGNEITAMQGDGLRLAGVENVTVSDNYMHDFSATPNEYTHSDFIQMWTRNADTISNNVTISGNVLDTGNGVAVQAIWLGNTEYRTGADVNHLYQDITVTDNLIYSGAANGIGVEGANNVLVENNTLLWNEDAVTVKQTGDTSYEPRIRFEGVTNGEANNNITTNIVVNGDVDLNDNVIISYDPSDDNYVGDHFVNASNGGDIGPNGGWQLEEGSSLVGTGASASQPDGWEAPTGGGTFSNPEPEPEPEPETPETPVVVETPVTPVTPVTPITPVTPVTPVTPAPVDPDDAGDGREALFFADFEDGVADLSGYDSNIRNASEDDIVTSRGDSSYEIGDGQMVRMHVSNDQIHELDSFGFEMEITLLDSDDVGRFLHFPRAFEASVERDGTVTFELRTDEGTFEVTSGDTVLADGAAHLFAVGYDDQAGKLSMSIDGTVVGTTEASGSTGEGAFHGMTVGSIWGNSVDAVVDDIFLGTDPMDAGVDMSLEVGETFEAAPDDPQVSDLYQTLFATDFESGIQDVSGNDTAIRNGDEDDIVATGGGDHAFQTGDGDFMRLHKDSEHIEELDGFALSLDIKLLDDDDTGRFIHFPRTFEAWIEDDRSISFRLDTDEGTFRVNSGDSTFDDLQEHSFSIGYDGDAEQLTMAIDGEVVDTVAASGETGEIAHHGLAIGSIWGDSVEAEIDNVWFGAPVDGAETTADAGLTHALISSAVIVPEESDTSDRGGNSADDDEWSSAA